MNTIRNQNSESYKPDEIPTLLSKSEEFSESNKYNVYKDMPYHINIIELPSTLKLVGVAKTHDWSFTNIEDYHKNYSNLVNDKSLPYIEVGVTSDMRNIGAADYIYGCLVNSLDNIPDGMYGFDTGFKKFAVMTFRANNAEELCASDKHGLSIAFEYLSQHWIPKNKDIIIDINNRFQFRKEYNRKICDTSIFEVYRCNIDVEPEMSLYIPLKD